LDVREVQLRQEVFEPHGCGVARGRACDRRAQEKLRAFLDHHVPRSLRIDVTLLVCSLDFFLCNRRSRESFGQLVGLARMAPARRGYLDTDYPEISISPTDNHPTPPHDESSKK
jgi:hypothetical protein